MSTMPLLGGVLDPSSTRQQLLSSACPVPADAALLGSLSAAGLAAPRWPRVGWSVPHYPHSRPAKAGWLVPYFTHCAHLWGQLSKAPMVNNNLVPCLGGEYVFTCIHSAPKYLYYT